MGIEADSGRVDKLLEELEGKDIAEVIGAGISKLASVPSGAGGGMAAAGGGGGGGGAAAGGGDAGAAKEEEKEEEKKEDEEEEDDGAPWPVVRVCVSGSYTQLAHRRLVKLSAVADADGALACLFEQFHRVSSSARCLELALV